MHRDGMVGRGLRPIRQSGGIMGALYDLLLQDQYRTTIYAHDEQDALEIANRWYNNPEQARIQLHEEAV